MAPFAYMFSLYPYIGRPCPGYGAALVFLLVAKLHFHLWSFHHHHFQQAASFVRRKASVKIKCVAFNSLFPSFPAIRLVLQPTYLVGTLILRATPAQFVTEPLNWHHLCALSPTHLPLASITLVRDLPSFTEVHPVDANPIPLG